LSAPARSSEHLRWLPAKSNRCAVSAACLGRSPKVAAETAAEGKFLTELQEWQVSMRRLILPVTNCSDQSMAATTGCTEHRMRRFDDN